MGEVRALPGKPGGIMDKLELWTQKTVNWASHIKPIKKVFFIGSQVRQDKTAGSGSDLDVAITMEAPHGYTDWFYNEEGWSAALQSEIDVPIHLLRGGGTLPNSPVEAAVSDHGLLVFERK